MLRLLLLDALSNPDRSDRPAEPNALVSDAARSATEWIGVGADDREKVIRELLGLADALRPHPPRDASLADKVAAVHQGLMGSDIPHAVGGALAVGYYGVPRSTLDIDVNVFVPAESCPTIRDALGGIGLDAAIEIDREETGKEEELRVEWDPNSLHLFFSCDPLHDQMRSHVRYVPFNGATIPIIAPEHLVIRKVLLDRTKDWIDIEQILVATDPLDLWEIEDWLERMVGANNPQTKKLAEVKAGLSLG
jgi:hypothetical protein